MAPDLLSSKRLVDECESGCLVDGTVAIALENDGLG